VSVIDTPLALPKTALLTVWTMVELGDPHPILGSNLHYWTPAGTDGEQHERAMTLLTEQRCARNGRLSPLWTDTLRTVAFAEHEFYAWCAFADGSSCAVLVAARERDAVRVIVNDHVVVFEPIEPQWLARSLLTTLPEVAGAAVGPVRVRRELFENPHARPANVLAEPPDTRDVELLADTMAAPRDAVHQAYAAVRAADGSRRRSSPVTALDLTGRGRVLTYLTGDDHVVLSPGTPGEAVTVLNDTAGALTALP
jgi:hypothetical protein